MSVERLGPSAAILATLRAEMAKRSERTASRAPAREAGEDGADAAGSRDIAVLRRTLAEMLQGVDPADPAAMKSARPKLVRAILMWEFSHSLRDHPDWQDMLASIVDALERDPSHQAQFSALVADLTR